jgi:hypothetical protein
MYKVLKAFYTYNFYILLDFRNKLEYARKKIQSEK